MVFEFKQTQFEKVYLKSGLDKNKKLIFNKYQNLLTDPIKNLDYYIDLIKVKFQLFYLKVINYK